MSKITDCPAERATYFFGGKLRILFNLFNKKRIKKNSFQFFKTIKGIRTRWFFDPTFGLSLIQF